IIRIGNWKRNVSLPTGLARLDISGAKYEEDRLNIFFDATDTREISEEELRSKRWENLKSRFRGT
ncbi:MAG: ArsA family ATPase, partial [Caldilineaceae bacterium]|nr:ArsA family ATPase [Caldilineaceae bacterium]